METVALILMTTAAAVWTGAIVFQSAVVAPTVFMELETATAGSFLRRLFPRFFRLGIVCGALMLTALLFFGTLSGWTPSALALACATVIMLVLEAISLAMVPHINAARDAGPTHHARFVRLHRMSVAFTVAILLLGVAVIATIATRAAAGV